MKNNQLNRVVKLISRTHDKAIVFDQETDEVVVMMPLESYEGMVGMDEYLPEIPPFDGESNEAHFGVDESKTETDDLPSAGADFVLPDDELTEDDFEDDVSEEFDGKAKGQFAIPKQRLDFAEDWASAPRDSSVEAEESLHDIPHEDEEEKFYLEPVE